MANTVTVPGHPILGNLREFRADRAEMQLRLAREYPEAARLRFGVVRALLIQSPALAYEVLATKNASFTKTPGLTTFLKPMLGTGLLTSEGEYHGTQRKLIAPAFAYRRVAAYASTMAERAEKVEIREGKTVDVADELMRLTLKIVGKTLFNVEVAEEADTFGSAVTIAMENVMTQLTSLVPLPPIVPTPRNLRTRRAAKSLDAIVYRIIADRRRHRGDRGDLLSVLLDARDEQGVGMTDREVRDEAMTLFLAGHETTANALAWALYLLAKNLDKRAKLEAEVDSLGHAPAYEELEKLPYTLAVLKESMRLYPPAYLIARRAIEPVTIGETHVKKNTIVMVNVLGIQRRADLFPEPESFAPERFLGDFEKQLPRCAYFPFGAGPRVCIGTHFALMEGHVLLAALLRRFRFDLVDPKAKIEMDSLVTLRPRGGVMMRTTQRPASARRSQAAC